jgi:hypothetical protein
MNNRRCARWFRCGPAALLLLCMTAGARADVIFHTSPGALQPEENVLLQNGGTGFDVIGHTNQTNTQVNFLSNVQIQASGGQADIEANPASNILKNLEISLEDGTLRFTELEFNVFKPLVDGTITIDLMGFDLTPDQAVLNISQNGQNYIGIEAINGQWITKVTLNTNTDVQKFRQFRIGGIGTQINEVVPEGSSLLLLVGGALPLLGGAVRARRARKK